jgi:acetylornithine deacetylase
VSAGPEDAAAGRVEAIARELISFNTTVGDPGHTPLDERACQEHVAGLLGAAGFEVDLWEPEVAEVEAHPMFMAGQNWHERPIVVGRLPGSGGGRSLMFNGHIDTVPAGDLGAWTTDPWTPELRDGRLYGRGACDMKGGVAAMLAAALALAERGRLSGDLVVEVVTDEEVNGMGTVAATLRGHRADAALVPEPTGLDVWIAFRGILNGSLALEGRPGHVEVAQPHWTRGGAVNAVHKALEVLARLRELDDEWRTRPDKQHPLCSTGEVNVTKLAGGEFYSTVPERCEATINICYVPGEEDETGYGGRVKAEVEARLAAIARTDAWLEQHPPSLRWAVDFPPAEISADEPIVHAVVGAASQLGGSPRILGLDTWDDTVTLIREGGIPAVSFGPGSNDQAHATDEFVDLAELQLCARMLTRVAAQWCAAAA